MINQGDDLFKTKRLGSSTWTNVMKEKPGKIHSAAWAVGGCTLIGLGAGLTLLHYSALAFVGTLLACIGLGLVIAALLTRKSQ